MASGSSSRGRGSGARGRSSRARAADAPSADDVALLAPQLNPTFVAMSATDLIAHLNRFRRTDYFVDAALVFAERERRLAEVEDFARAANKNIDRLLDEIQARDNSALEAQAKIRLAAETEAALRANISRAAETEAALRTNISRAAETEASMRAKISQAAETETALRAKIRTLQLGTAALISFSSGISGGDLTQQAAGHGRREPVPQDIITISDDDATCAGVQNTVAQGEVGDGVPMKTRHGELNRTAPHSTAAPLPKAAALISSGISGRGLTQQAAGHGRGREPVPQDFITDMASDDGVGATGFQTMFAQGEVGDDVPMTMRAGALNRAAPHLADATLPSAAALISSGISGRGRGRGITQQAAGHGRKPVPQDSITASDDATGVQTMIAQGEVGDDVPKEMRHGALNRAAPHHAATPLPSAAALISSGSGISRRGLTQQAASHGREPVPQDFITGSDDGVGFDDATGVQTMFAEVGDNMPRRSSASRIGAALPAARSMPDELAERAVERVVVDASPPAVGSSHHQVQVSNKAGVVDSQVLEAAASKRKQGPAATSASEHKEQQPLKKKPKTAAPHLLVADPLPDTLIDDDERAAEEVATDVVSCNEVAQGDHEVPEDVLRARVTADPRRVPEEEAQGEDATASRSEGEQQAARATKKPRKFKGTCFYNEVFKVLKEKQELLKKKEERLAKEASAAASKQLNCRCWWSDAPYKPSESAAVEEDSGDDSQN